MVDRYAIDGCLLGRSLPTHYSEHYYLSIVFPSILHNGTFPFLGIEGLMDKYGVDQDEWGKINSYLDIRKPDTIDAWISTVLVECYADNNTPGLSSFDVQKISKQLLHALQIIKPEAIRIPDDEQPNVMCEVKTSVAIGERKPRIEIQLTSVIDDRKEKITLRELKLGIRNINRAITAPFEMLDNSRQNVNLHDTRAAVLNCATSIEVMLKKRISEYLDNSSTAQSVKEYVMRQADGYSKLVGLCKSFGLSLDQMPNVKDAVFKVRDRVIHGGYVPSYVEADNAYNCTRAALFALDVPMFE
ncbi:MAG: hypothetical protein IKX20_09000 [Paludibacteraceae bacterium]|nr:hypothetical protein [Paludibacteraceae bacterium]